MARGYPRPLYELAELGRLSVLANLALPGARELGARLWTLPTHGRVSEGDLERLGRWIAGP